MGCKIHLVDSWGECIDLPPLILPCSYKGRRFSTYKDAQEFLDELKTKLESNAGFECGCLPEASLKFKRKICKCFSKKGISLDDVETLKFLICLLKEEMRFGWLEVK